MHVFMRLTVAILRFLYSIVALFIKPRNQITFLSRQSDIPSLDIESLASELSARSSDLRVVVLSKKLSRGPVKTMSYAVHLLAQMVAIARSSVLIVDGYSILASTLPKRKNLRIIQMGHSMGTMKKFGHAVLGKSEGASVQTAKIMNMHGNYDVILASSSAYIQDLVTGYNCSPHEIAVYPLPRYDALLDKVYKQQTSRRIYDAYPQLEGGKVVVYCPTFRKDESNHQLHLSQLLASFPFGEYHLVVKVHPLSKLRIEDERVLTAPEFSTFEMLFVADLIISDYSCIVYEAGLLGIPLYFYAFDLQDYDVSRGLAIDYADEMPGPICTDADALVRAISAGDYDHEELARFINRYVRPTEHATQDIADLVIEQMKMVSI